MTTSKSNEYIIYGTTNENLEQILKDGYINNKPNKKRLGVYWSMHSLKKIPTQLIYYNITNQANMWPYTNSCIVFDKKLLQDYAFIARARYASDASNIINSGKGKLDKPPKLTKIKSYISQDMTKKKPLDAHTRFIDSHTINFTKNIPLDIYAKKIMFIGKKGDYKEKQELIDSIVKLANTRSIPTKFRDYKLRGNLVKPLNNFMNSIENK